MFFILIVLENQRKIFYDVIMIVFLSAFTLLTFAFVYFFQVIHLPLLGFQMVAFLLLIFSFLSKKRGKTYPIAAMNIIVVLSMLVFYFSTKFTFLTYGDMDKIILILISFVVAQVMGIFWGKLFYKQSYEKEQQD